MSRDWIDVLMDRAAGNVDGFLGANEDNGDDPIVPDPFTDTGTLQEIRNRMGFFPSSYGTYDTTGASDSFDAIKGAWSAIIANNGGILDLGKGTCLLDKAASQLRLPANFTGMITVRGAGQLRSSVKLSANNKHLILCDTSSGVGVSYGRIRLEGFTVDVNNTTSVGAGVHGKVLGFGGRFNIDRVEVVNVDTINSGAPGTAGSINDRRALDLTISVTSTPTEAYSATNVYIDGCNFGRGGSGGGNTGVVLQAFTSDTQTGVTVAGPGATPRTAVTMDNVECRNSTWDSGQTITGFQASVGFQFGGSATGGRLRVYNCHAKNSADDGFEINHWMDAEVRDSSTTDCWNEDFYYRPFTGAPSGASRAHIRFVNCVAKRKYRSAPGFWAQSTTSNPMGNITFENCRVEVDGDVVDTSSRHCLREGIMVTGAFQSLRITDFRRTVINWTHDQPLTNLGFNTAVSVTQLGGRAHIEIDGVTEDLNGTFTNTGANATTFPSFALTFDHLSDASVNVRNVNVRANGISKTGVGTYTYTYVRMGGNLNYRDQFGSPGTPLTSNYYFDAGSASDLSSGTGTVTSVANHTVKKELRLIQGTGASVNATPNQLTGPFTDMSYSVKYTYAQVSGFTSGVKVKINETNTNFGEGYITDDGVNTIFNLDKVIAGVRTNLATVTLGARLADGAVFYVRCYIRDNTLVADYFTSAPSFTVVTASGANTLTATLTGSDIAAIGSKVQGRVGPSFTPMSTSWSMDDGNLIVMSVVRNSTFKGLTPVDMGTWLTTFTGFQMLVAPTLMRVTQLEIADSSFEMAQGAGTVTEFSGIGASGSYGDTITRRNIKYVTTPQPAAITYPGSTVAYVNNDSRAVQVNWYGGTVTAVSVSTDGGTSFVQVRGSGDGAVTLQAGQQIKWTSSSNPTVVGVPIS